jgi:hypothetical protein
LAAVTLLAALAPASFARDDGFEADYASARAAAVPKLLEFAEWCSTGKLYAERDKAYEAIIVFDPKNDPAHRALKYSRRHDGSWDPPEKKVESKNYNSGLLDACIKKRTVVATEFREAALALADKYKAPASVKSKIGDDVLLIDSDDAGGRALKGEGKLDGQWVLLESVRGKARRNELKTMVQQAVAAVPPAGNGEATEREKLLGIAWKTILSTPRVRVVSTGSLDEARKAVIMCNAAAQVFKQLTGAQKDLPPDFTVYLLADSGTRDQFLAGWQGWNDDERKRMHTWAGTGLPGEVSVARWDVDEAHRLDGAVRHTLGLMTLWEFGFDHRKAAWIWEGFGMYLTRELVGTRYTWYGSAPAETDPEQKELLGKLMMSDVNWMNETYQRAKRGRTPPLAKVFERKIDALGVDDVTVAYAFCAYLVEGRPEQLNDVFTRIGKGEASGAAVAAALGVDLAALDKTFVRWMGERK